MEGAPKFESANDNNPEWRGLSEKAETDTDALVVEIEGFDVMLHREKIAALNNLFSQLEEGGNHNRFIAKEVSRRIAVLEEEDRHAVTMASLGEAA